jgi:ubiquinone/menaquinone biosynthesis C-methylase UbiE
MSTSFSADPQDKDKFSQKYDSFYTSSASLYNRLVKLIPTWGNWLRTVLPHIQGPDVLELSFGTGYLLKQIANQFQTFGIDLNHRMTRVAFENLNQAHLRANLQIGNVEAIPYRDASFNTVVNTIAFSGYPAASGALSEIRRVIKPGARLVMIDINYPLNQKFIGTKITQAWKAGGDLIRDMPALFEQFGFANQEEEVGAFGSVHLYLAEKPLEDQ